MHVFQGKWITDEAFAELAPVDSYIDVYEMKEQPQTALQNSHVLFRDSFVWNGVGKVYLYFSADDYCKAYINGEQVSQGPAPAYPFHYYYVRVEVTKYLRTGANTLAFHTLYQGLVNRVWVSGDLRHGLLFDVVCRGETLACSSAAHTKVRFHSGFSVSHIAGYDTQFMENYDSKSPEDGFEKSDYDDAEWACASERKFVDYRLYPQPIAPVETEELTPILLRETETEKIFDFGGEFVGVPLIRVEGKRGDVLEILCGEELDESGNVRHEMRCNCDYREKWILKDGIGTLEPFDYKAFRYMTIRVKKPFSVLSLCGKARHYPFRLKAKCVYRDESAQQVFALCCRTLQYGLQEGYLDCPSREKGQYFGDGAWSAMTHIVLTGDVRLYQKFIQNAFESMQAAPGGTAQGPCALIQKIAEYPLMAAISLRYYQKLTGDTAFVQKQKARYYELMKFYYEHYARADGMISVHDRWNVVDWPQSARDDYDFDLTQGKVVHGYHNVMNAYWLFALQAYEALYGAPDFVDVRAVEKAYRGAFYLEETKRFKDSEQSEHCALASQAFGLMTGTVSDGEAEAVLEEMIAEKRLSRSNLFVTPVLFAWLKLHKREKLLHSLICDEKAWLNMLSEGATTTFEAFSKDGKWNTSLCHTMFAFPALFMVENKLFE